MSKNNYVIPPEILAVLGPPPLLASENPKRWNETLARFAQSYPPKDADDFEGWKDVWNLACDHWEEERMKRFKVEVLEAPRRAKSEQKLLALADFLRARDSRITFSVTHGWSAFWRGRPWLAGRRIGETSSDVGSSRFWIGWVTKHGDKCARSTCRG